MPQESGGGLMVAAIQLSIMLGGALGGVLLDHLSIGATFFGASVLLLVSSFVASNSKRSQPGAPVASLCFGTSAGLYDVARWRRSVTCARSAQYRSVRSALAIAASAHSELFMQHFVQHRTRQEATRKRDLPRGLA
ncbi:hypothetical protein LL967_12050 [Xanthomonas campestris pv. zinniae]|nr:hypothetical protein [Xanthomonas campestris pv. zinniae]